MKVEKYEKFCEMLEAVKVPARFDMDVFQVHAMMKHTGTAKMEWVNQAFWLVGLAFDFGFLQGQRYANSLRKPEAQEGRETHD